MPFAFRVGIVRVVVWAACVSVPTFAVAQQNIGSAATARNDVSREISGASGALAVGEAVYRDEAVRTGSDSSAKLVFLDSTNLAVGPVSRVVLDRFVFDAAPSSQAMAVNLAKGVFRFTTGSLDKSAYSITTPTASIGVRGTVLDIGVDSGRTRVTLMEGKALVCPRRKGEAFEQEARDCANPGAANKTSVRGRHCDCVTLDQGGQTASVSSVNGVLHAGLTSNAVQFASLCAADPGLCSSSGVQAADAGGGASASSLCGR
jgi:hypothetical protein